jgi:hypothetical protein
MKMEDLAVKERAEERSYSVVIKRKYPHWQKGRETPFYKRMKKARIEGTPRVNRKELT